jgi:DNA-binding NarL/FixJ family response regulator
MSASVRLSPRQHEVLSLLAEGVSAQAIARRLGLSESTVRNHIRDLLRRLDCHSQLQAVARAREQHLL